MLEEAQRISNYRDEMEETSVTSVAEAEDEAAKQKRATDNAYRTSRRALALAVTFQVSRYRKRLQLCWLFNFGC